MEAKNLYFIGFMGAGKSTVSQAVAERLGLARVEMDEEIVRRAGKAIPAIFAEEGEAHFRELEQRVLFDCAAQKPCVVSCGGGVVMKEENVAHIREHGTIVLLSATPQTILERVGGSHERPLLEGRKSVEGIAELMEQRRPHYENAADLIVATDGRTADEICDEIITKVKMQ